MVLTSTPVTSTNRPLAPLLRAETHAWAMERPFVVAAGLTAGMTVVDLGCGGGTMTRFLAGEVGPDGRVIAVDADADVVDAAREADATRGGTPIDWIAASAYDTGLDDDSVDMVVARHLFQHLTDPARALAEIARILRPDGCVVLLDTHDGLLHVSPSPEGFTDFVERAQAQQKLHGGDRHVGKRLAALLTLGGFGDVRSDVHVFDTQRLPVDLFTDLAVAPLQSVFPGATREDAEAHVEACRATLHGHTGHGSAGFYATSARKTVAS